MYYFSYTKQGSLKDKAEISENGYYFMPLINLPHGEYQLKVSAPKGLSFSPDHHKINFGKYFPGLFSEHSSNK
jgi:hypothetical protein